MLLDVTIKALEPQDEARSVQVGTSPEGNPVLTVQKTGRIDRDHVGNVIYVATIEREGPLADDVAAGDLVAKTVVLDRLTGQAFKLMSSGGFETRNGVRVEQTGPIRLLVVKATAVEVEAARRDELVNLRRLSSLLESLRRKLWQANEDLDSTIWAGNERGIAVALADRRSLEAEFAEVFQRHAKVVASLSAPS